MPLRDLECPDYFTQQVYTCQDHVGQGRGCCALPGGWGPCCDIGCCPCDDDALEFMRVYADGRRWMRPAEGKTHRDAQGIDSPLLSNVALPVPLFLYYERAPCYDMFGAEFFDMDVCDCYPPPNSVPDEDWVCEHGENVGDVMQGNYSDCWGYKGHRYTLPDNWMWCRTVTKHDERVVNLHDGPPFPTLFARSSHPHANKGTPSHACAPNALTWLTQKAPVSTCRAPWCSKPPCYYNQNEASRNIWKEVAMDWGAGDESERPHLIDTGDNFVSDPAMLDLKNAVLEKVVTAAFPDGSPQGIRFDRLDQHDASTPDISQWSRGYNGPTDITACENLLVAAPLTGSYFVDTHLLAPVDYVITSVSVTLHLVPYRMLNQFGGKETLPYARVWIRAECRARVEVRDGDCVLLPHRYIRPIIFKDDQGRQLAAVPTLVEWWGFLGHNSVPKIENIETDSPVGALLSCELAEDLSVVVIPGWPVMKGTFPDYPSNPDDPDDPDNPNRLYGGRVRIDFKNDIWWSYCNGS